MATVLEKVRTYIRDTSTPQRFTDPDLENVITYAIDEVNAWSGTTYTRANYEALTVPLYQSQLMYLVCKIWAVQQDIQDPKRYIKFVTQDTQYDASEVASRLNALSDSLQKEFKFKLYKWIGLDLGGTLSCPTEFEEIVNNPV